MNKFTIQSGNLGKRNRELVAKNKLELNFKGKEREREREKEREREIGFMKGQHFKKVNPERDCIFFLLSGHKQIALKIGLKIFVDCKRRSHLVE